MELAAKAKQKSYSNLLKNFIKKIEISIFGL